MDTTPYAGTSDAVIDTLPTPNPEALMFRLQETLVPSGTFEYRGAAQASDAPLARRLFDLAGVTSVLVAPRFVTVNKDPGFTWPELVPQIKAAIRATDLAAKIGGDEFVVILARTDLPGATRVAEALRAGVERVGQRLGFGHGAVTVSIGISEYDPTLVSEGNPLADADEAMYRAKASGRNMVAEGGLTRTSDER